jgi:hypothetical protein
LNYFRLPNFTGDNVFYPFTEEAVVELIQRMQGHPSWTIRSAHLLLDKAAEMNIPNIDGEFVRTNLPSRQ